MRRKGDLRSGREREPNQHSSLSLGHPRPANLSSMALHGSFSHLLYASSSVHLSTCPESQKELVSESSRICITSGKLLVC